MTYSSDRISITPEVVAEAVRIAAHADHSKDIRDYFDSDQRYLQLRQRGRSVNWFVRAKQRSKKIGSAIRGRPNYLTVTKARQQAGEVYFGKVPPSAPPAAGWTWAELDRRYRELLTQRRKKRGRPRIKHPSPGTQADVRLCFSKPEFAEWQELHLAELTQQHLIKLIKKVHTARGYRSCEKTMAYVKAALTWARSQHPLESGLADKWWAGLAPPDMTEPELDALGARAKALEAAKSGCLIAHLGELLVRHEQFCAERSGNEKISPGVRWGIWWLVLTANRSFTTTRLRRDALRWTDPFNPYSIAGQSWGVAEWPAEHVKNKRAFMLPIPPIGLHIARCAIWDWDLSIGRRRGPRDNTQWVFASTRRHSRATHPENGDPSIYPKSLADHLRALRGRKGANETDYLADLPTAWPHLIRSVNSNFFALHLLTVPPAASSAMIGHVLPSDREFDHREISPTTREYYLTAQYMDLKIIAMKVWSEALLDAYIKAGGRLPMPREKDPSKPEGPDWILPQLPSS